MAVMAAILSSRAGRGGMVVICVLTVVVAVAAYLQRSSTTGAVGSRPAAARGLDETVVFYYQHIRPSVDESKFRGASAVVTTPQTDERAVVKAIHAVHARAFMYVNLFWFPTDRAYEGIDMAHHMGWAFCAHGDAPSAGRRIAGSEWYYLDLNEQDARTAVMAYLRHLRSLGFDGVFFDRGSPSLRGAGADPIAWEQSSCTEHPVMPGDPRYADVFVNVLHEVKQRLHLEIYINYGHPFSSVRLRPDPNDPGCRAGSRTKCTYRSDIWHDVDRVIDENANTTTLRGFAADYEENLASERGGSRAGRPARVIRAVKTSTRSRALVFYLWARARLFRLATYINTGDDGCPGVPPGLRSKCQRFGTHPELTRIRLGEPLDPLPRREDCTSGSTLACVWIRRYALGTVVVNTRNTEGHVAALIGVGSCRHVVAVTMNGRRPVSGCTSRLRYAVPPRSGAIFSYSG